MMARVPRGKALLRAVLPPFVVSAMRRVRRRPRVPGMALSPPDPPLTDGVVELRPIGKGDLGLIEQAASDSEIRRRFGLSSSRPSAYLGRYRKASREQCGAKTPDVPLG